jgi:putative endonuclease
MKYYLYILKSLKDNKYYIGITGNVEKRLISHNQGKTKSTKSRKPFIVIYIEKCQNRCEARKREIYLKSYKGVKEKIEITKKFDIGE